MSILSNVEIQALLEGENPPIRGVAGELRADAHNSALEAASIRLRVGTIFQLDRDIDDKNKLIKQPGDTIIKEGGVVLVLTAEEIDFDANIAGIMTPKSGGMAERGILITNTGHVDPGYKGFLRFVVINMGHEPFCLRKGDIIAKLMMFKLAISAKPTWSDMHDPISAPDSQSVRPLGYDFLNIERRAAVIAEQKAKDVAKDIMIQFGIPAFVFGTLGACLLGVVTVAITFAVGK